MTLFLSSNGFLLPQALIVICAAGMIILWAMLTFLGAPLDDMLGRCWGHFVTTALTVFYCITVYPLIIRLFTGKTAAE